MEVQQEVDIYSEPVPEAALMALGNKNHSYYVKFNNIKQLLDYFLFGFNIRVFVERTPSGVYSCFVEDATKGNLSAIYKRALSTKPTEIEAWEWGLRAAVNYIYNNKSQHQRDAILGITIFVELLGLFDRRRLESLKNALSSHPPLSRTTKMFKFEDYPVLPEFAKRVITYCEFMLGEQPPVYEQQEMFGADTGTADISTVEVMGAPAEPVIQGYNLVDDTEPMVGTIPNPDPQPFELMHIDDIEAEYGEDFVEYLEQFDGEFTTLSVPYIQRRWLDYQAEQNATLNAATIYFTRQEIMDRWGVGLVDYIEDHRRIEIETMDNNSLAPYILTYQGIEPTELGLQQLQRELLMR